MNDTAEQIVQRQVDAYNRHDLDALVATHHRDAIYIRHSSGDIIINGQSDVRGAFGALFAQHPHVRVAILNRMTLGHVVIDLEEVTGREQLPDDHVVAIYEVLNGLIHKVRVVRA